MELQLFESGESLAWYEARTDWTDTERFAASIPTDDPEVASWLATLTPSQRSELGL